MLFFLRKDDRRERLMAWLYYCNLLLLFLTLCPERVLIALCFDSFDFDGIIIDTPDRREKR